MAYVAISQALINETEANINRMKDRERSQLPVPADELKMNHDDPLAIQIAWGQHVHLKSTLPDEWTQTVSNICVCITYDFNGAPRDVSFNIRPKDSKEFHVPYLRSNGYSSMNVKMSEHDSFAQSYASALIIHRRSVDEINVKWNDIKEQVIKFLRSAKSLNEALKLWPALALYISDTYISRVNDKVSRGATVSKAAEILAQMETDNITAAAVSSKLS
tara:strand:+ start:116 stop:769 length:654 start_codon:yes stop_codon:yes gene_type:complete